jgi:hypothetical protein
VEEEGREVESQNRSNDSSKDDVSANNRKIVGLELRVKKSGDEIVGKSSQTL